MIINIDTNNKRCIVAEDEQSLSKGYLSKRGRNRFTQREGRIGDLSSASFTEDSDQGASEEKRERIQGELRDLMRELALAIATGNFDKVRRLKSFIEGIFNEAHELGISIKDIQDVIREIESVEAKQIAEQSLESAIENDLAWFKSIEETAYSLSKDIDSFITPAVTEQLNEYTERLDRGGDLTEDEAREFVDTHLSPPRFDEHVRLIQENSRLIDEHIERRNTLIKVHGESHEAVKSFDEKTKESVKQLAANNKKVKTHMKLLEM
ncbi:MAG: hypothetical protein RLN62_02725 [Rickettsiales bacterium]